MEPAGNDTSLDQLVEEHLPAALRFAVRLTGDPVTAEEIVQDALLRVSRSWKEFRNESSFRTWLFRIVINVFRSQCAKPPAAVRLTADPVDAAAADPAETVQVEELKRLVAAKVSTLPPRQREVFILLTWEGLTVSETAEALGMTPANVHSTLHGARTRLREELAPYLVEQPDE